MLEGILFGFAARRNIRFGGMRHEGFSLLKHLGCELNFHRAIATSVATLVKTHRRFEEPFRFLYVVDKTRAISSAGCLPRIRSEPAGELDERLWREDGKGRLRQDVARAASQASHKPIARLFFRQEDEI